MDTEDTLSGACRALPACTGRLAELVSSAPELSIAARNSDWTLRHVTLHVATTARYFAEMARLPRPAEGGLAGLHEDIERRVADITEEDPIKLGALLQDGVEEFVETCAERPGSHTVDFAGCPIDLAALAGLMLSEVLLHGYDVAFALGQPWPIDPGDACLSLAGLAPVLGLIVDPDRTRGLSAGYGIELRDGPALTVRFTDGVYGLEAAGTAPVDVTISADPVAFLMVGTGRLSRYEAVALGLLSAGGDHPELALGFPDLFQKSLTTRRASRFCRRPRRSRGPARPWNRAPVFGLACRSGVDEPALASPRTSARLASSGRRSRQGNGVSAEPGPGHSRQNAGPTSPSACGPRS